MSSFTLAAVPGELQWLNTPTDWKAISGDSLTISAGAETDWFLDPAGKVRKDNAPSALFAVSDPAFMLSAKVKVGFAGSFDAGVLQLYERGDVWAKLCFEYSPQRQPMVVSVVTREFSDDCNSIPVDGDEIYYRISRKGSAFLFHYSVDGQYWNFVRNFSLGAVDNLRVGFCAQAPVGQGCTATFSEIKYEIRELGETRNGE